MHRALSTWLYQLYIYHYYLSHDRRTHYTYYNLHYNLHSFAFLRSGSSHVSRLPSLIWKTPKNNACYAGSGADPGFVLGRGALVSCSTSTPTNHIVLFFLQNTSCIRKPQVISGGVRTPCTLPLDPPLLWGHGTQKQQADWVLVLNYFIGACQPMIFFLLKIGRKEYFSEKLIYLFLVLPCIYYILFLEKREWLASKQSSDNRKIQLIEQHCTGLKARASFYKILVSIKVMSPASAVWQAKMDEISPNFVNFRA